MSTGNLDSFDLKSQPVNGLIREDVMAKIFDISRIPLPFTDIIGTDSHKNERAEWTLDKLADPVTTNKTIDGDDVDQNDETIGDRVGNHSQTSVKEVQVSTRAIESDTIGRSNELSYQVTRKQQELKRDMEAQMLTNLPSIAGTSAVAGQSGGLDAWLRTNSQTAAGVALSTGGFNTATGIVDAHTNGVKAALTETGVRDVAENIFNEGGNPTVAMCMPTVARRFSEYLFTSSARIATLTAETDMKGPAKAVGSINVFITDFGVTLDITPNRLQPVTATATSSMFLIDPEHVSQSFLHSVRVEPLAKTGLSEKRLMSADYCLKVLSERASGAIIDIDNAVPVVA